MVDYFVAGILMSTVLILATIYTRNIKPFWVQAALIYISPVWYVAVWLPFVLSYN